MHLTPEQCDDFWMMADTDGNGTLSLDELRAALRKYNLSEIQIEGIFCDIDEDGDNCITLKEFKDQMMQKKDRAESVKQLFQQADTNNDRTLDKSEVRQMMAQIYDAKVADQVTKKFFKHCGTSVDGAISWEQFEKFFG